MSLISPVSNQSNHLNLLTSSTVPPWIQNGPESDCYTDMEKLSDLLAEISNDPDPSNPTVAQLRALCIDINALVGDCTALNNSPLGQDHVLAGYILGVIQSDYPLAQAASEYNPADPQNVAAMAAAFKGVVDGNGLSSVIACFEQWEAYGPYNPPT